MSDIAARFPENPLLIPSSVRPSHAGLRVACLLNPGVFRFKNKICLAVRVAERPDQTAGVLSIPVIDEKGKIQIKKIRLDDADLTASDARVIRYKGIDYLTTLSHLRIFCSDDGRKFSESTEYPLLFGEGPNETFGIEDCRVTEIDHLFYLTYTAVSEKGVAVGLRTTKNWLGYQQHGPIMPPHNKDFCMFTEKIKGKYHALHRPTTFNGLNNIWLAESPDGIHWGNHRCLMTTRDNHWENARIGAGAAPIKTEKGWLEIYHAANAAHRYCLGAVLLDINDPFKIIARTDEPIMEPTEEYEQAGFFGHVVFTNGHIVDGDLVTVYYGAADEYVCGAEFRISNILKELGF